MERMSGNDESISQGPMASRITPSNPQTVKVTPCVPRGAFTMPNIRHAHKAQSRRGDTMTNVLGEIDSAALANNIAMGGSLFTQADAALALDVIERMVDVHIIKIKSAIAGYRRDSV